MSMQKYYHVLLLGSFPGSFVGSGNEATCTVMHCDDRGELIAGELQNIINWKNVSGHYWRSGGLTQLEEKAVVYSYCKLTFSELTDIVCFI